MVGSLKCGYKFENLNPAGPELLVGLRPGVELARPLQCHHPPHPVHGPQHVDIEVSHQALVLVLV